MSTDPQNPHTDKSSAEEPTSASAGSTQDSGSESEDRLAESKSAQAPESEAGEEAGDPSPDSDGLQAEVRELKEKLLMAHADMQNVRRRSERDVENAHKYALEKFVAELLPVVDNLERATAAIDSGSEAFAAVTEGIELTLKNLLDVLARFNVEQLNPKGEAFNPDHHEAMAMVPQPDAKPNTIIEVYQKGYLLNGRLVRPAMVVVAQAAPA